MRRLAALEGLRGYAAFLVFLTHAFGLLLAKVFALDTDRLDLLALPAPAVVPALLFRSHYGVDLFFVLSGLLMAEIALRRWPGAGAFLARRALRIYPPYLASVLVAAGAAAAWFAARYSAADIAANLALLQGFFVLGIPAMNPVSWSLSFEAAFYLLVPLLALAARRMAPAATPLATGAMLAALFAAIVLGASALALDHAILLAYFALFIPGIALGLASAQTRQRWAAAVPTIIALFAWLAFEAAVKLELVSNRQPLYYALSAAAGGLLVLKSCDEGSTLARLLTRPAMLWLGRHSYSFFLIHYIVLHVLGLALDALLGRQHPAAYAALLVGGGLAASLGASWLLFQATEQWYFRRAKTAPAAPAAPVRRS